MRSASVFLRELRSPGVAAAAGFLLLVILIAILADVIAPFNGIAQSSDRLQGPSGTHWLGTDQFGRDILTRIIYGARLSFQVGFIAVGIAFVFGVTLGIIAGYYGGWVDGLIGILIDIMLAFPGILLALAIASVLGPGLYKAMVAVGISSIPSFARLVRSSVLQVKQTTYVEAARALGCSTPRLILRHLLPNVMTSVLVLATLGVATAILVGASLSFLGLGAQPPTAEWGAMLSQGRVFMHNGWWIMFFPGLAITITVLGVNFFGDGLRDLLDPRLRKQT